MRRDQLEHIIRAAGSILSEDGVIVIGSQAILGEHPFDAPPVTLESVEADILPLSDPDESKADLVSGTIGEESLFHTTFRIYGHGVSESTAILPSGWRERLVCLRNENTRQVAGYCLETHDLLISKYVAGRPKDLEFCASVVEAGLVQEDTLLDRLRGTDVPPERREWVANAIRRDFMAICGEGPQTPSLGGSGPEL